MAGLGRTLLSLLLAFGLTHCAPATEPPPTDEPLEEEVASLRGSCPRAYLVEDSAEGPEGSAPLGFTDLDERIFYWAKDSLHGYEPWRSNGTKRGTRLIEDIVPGPRGSIGFFLERAVVDGRVFFTVGSELWQSDGTPGGTSRVATFPAGSRPASFREYRGKLLFTLDTPEYGRELWLSDGTAHGTRLWLDFNPGPATGVLFNLIEFEGDFVFDGLLGEEGASRRVVGRVDRRGRVTELFSTPGDSEVRIFRLTSVGGRLYFIVDLIGGDADLYASDGTEGGARLVHDFGDNTSTPSDFADFQGQLYFSAGATSTGTELWRSDGTPEGTVQVRDIRPGGAGSFPSGLTVVKERLYFSANDGEHGEELWGSDGTEAGTVLAADLRPGAQGSSPFSLARVNKRLYFFADDGVHGREPWKVDGGRARLVADIAPGAASSQRFALPGRFALAGERLYFPADDGTHGEELWALPLSEAGCPRGSR